MSSEATVTPVPATAPAPSREPITSTDTSGQPNKFDNVGKIVGSKVKTLIGTVNKAGEHLRGNINAALDGTGDAIAGRKSNEVTSKGNNPVAPVATEGAAPVAESSTVAPAPENATPVDGEKKFPIGQSINKSLKRTATLIKNVTNKLRSHVTTGVDGVGSTISQQKDRASKRFSRTRAEPPAQEDVAGESAINPTTNTASEVVPAAHTAVALPEHVAAPVAQEA